LDEFEEAKAGGIRPKPRAQAQQEPQGEYEQIPPARVRAEHINSKKGQMISSYYLFHCNLLMIIY
jgi:hypothetical protein